MRELDAIRVSDLPILLTEETALARYAPLFPLREELARRLLALGIKDKYAFLESLAADENQLSARTGFPADVLRRLAGLFHCYDFVSRKLSEASGVSTGLVDALREHGVKTSRDFLPLCQAESAEAIAERYAADVRDVARLRSLCDLMRLPGVKDTRASLYLACGYASTGSVAREEPDGMRERIARYLAASGEPKSVPFRKELSTQIAVAKALPALVFPQGGRRPA